jgi:hypothetical protein
MVGFGSMMIAAHRGLYSLGLVLTIGVGTCLIVAILLVPAVLTIVSRWRQSAVPEAAQLGAPVSEMAVEAFAAADASPATAAPNVDVVPASPFPPAPHLGLGEARALPPWTLTAPRSFADR